MFKNNHKPRTATKAQVEALAKKLNVKIDDETDDNYIQIFLYTAKGTIFKSTDCHTAATSFTRAQPGEPSNEWQGKKPEGWGHCMEDLEFGIEDCPNPNCGYCERGLMNE